MKKETEEERQRLKKFPELKVQNKLTEITGRNYREEDHFLTLQVARMIMDFEDKLKGLSKDKQQAFIYRLRYWKASESK